MKDGRHALALSATLACLALGTGSALGQSFAKLGPAVREYVAVDAPVVALTHVVLLDGTGGPVKRDQTVIIDNGLIRSVGASATVAVPTGTKVLDLTGHTVFPGLIG